jgi:DNA-binding CsgD family transcriptional regulator
VFAALGIWLGLRFTRHTETVVVREVLVPAPVDFMRDQDKLEALGITPRELEILGLMAEGLSNREIAERVHVSENTVKTHSSRVFDKLGARRRTQAVQLGKELRRSHDPPFRMISRSLRKSHSGARAAEPAARIGRPLPLKELRCGRSC